MCGRPYSISTVKNKFLEIFTTEQKQTKKFLNLHLKKFARLSREKYAYFDQGNCGENHLI